MITGHPARVGRHLLAGALGGAGVQRDNLAGIDVHIDALERHDAAVEGRHAAQRKERLPPSSPRRQTRVPPRRDETPSPHSARRGTSHARSAAEACEEIEIQKPSSTSRILQHAAALGAAKIPSTLPETKAFRVLTALRFDNGRRTSFEAVILLDSSKGSDKANASASNKGKDEDKGPYSILSWQDQAETGSRPLKQAGR